MNIFLSYTDASFTDSETHPLLMAHNINKDISQWLTTGHAIFLEFDKEEAYQFSFSYTSSLKESVLIVSNENCMDFQVIKETHCINNRVITRPIKGTKFKIQRISRVDVPELTVVLESVFFEGNSNSLKYNNFDNQGRFYQPELKNFDSEAYGWTRMVAQVYPYSPETNNGTAWLLGKSNYLVSNAHVYKDRISDTGTYTGWVRFLVDPEDRTKAVHIEPGGKLITIGIPGSIFVASNDNNDDYGVISLNDFDYKYSRISDLVGGLGLNTDDENSHISENTFMPGFPQGYDSQQITSYFSANDLSYRSSIQSTVNKQVRTDCYAEGGNSGSPIISASENKVLGLLWGVAGGADADSDNIFRGIKGSHVWESIKDSLDDGEYSSFTGLAASYDVFPGQLLLDVDEDWHDIHFFSDDIFFGEFSGTLTSNSGYSLLHVKAKDAIDSSIVDITLRIAQRTDEGIFSLDTSHGTPGSEKNLVVCCKLDDNSIALGQSGTYHMWCGLEAKSADSQDVQSYVIVSIDVAV